MIPRTLQEITRNAISIISRWIGSGTKPSHDSAYGENSVDQSTPTSFDTKKGQRGTGAKFGSFAPKITSHNRSKNKSTENLLRCVICERLLPSAKALGRHYTSGQHEPNQSKESPTRVGGVGGVECPDCNLEFESVSDQRWHEMSKHQN